MTTKDTGGSAPYFHEISDEQWESMKAAGATWADVAKQYAPPAWCTYPEPLNGMMGCWSLVGRKVTGEDYCKNCELYAAHHPLYAARKEES